MKIALRSFILFIICLSMTACTATLKTQTPVAAEPGGAKDVVALLPLVNLTSYPNAGRIVGDILATELYAQSDFQIMERTEMVEKLQGDSKDIEAVVDAASAVKLARKLGAKKVIYGSVSEYRYKRGLDEEPAMAVNLRLLDVAGNKVLWAGSISGTSNCFFLCRDSLSLLTHKKCAELISDLVGGKR